jgi:hypothetical protein
MDSPKSFIATTALSLPLPTVISIIKSPELASIKWSKKESITGDVSGLNN